MNSEHCALSEQDNPVGSPARPHPVIALPLTHASLDAGTQTLTDWKSGQRFGIAVLPPSGVSVELLPESGVTVLPPSGVSVELLPESGLRVPLPELQPERASAIGGARASPTTNSKVLTISASGANCRPGSDVSSASTSRRS